MTALTLKMKMALTHDGAAPSLAIEEMYEMCKAIGIPIQKWPQWIEAQLRKHYGNTLDTVSVEFGASLIYSGYTDFAQCPQNPSDRSAHNSCKPSSFPSRTKPKN